MFWYMSQFYFNPLFPYGKRLCNRINWTIPARFQSTLPIREETAWYPHGLQAPYFNPLFPYGKRHTFLRFQGAFAGFQSTLPIREETRQRHVRLIGRGISIHSSHTGRDDCPKDNFPPQLKISIHSSHTGRDPI